MIKLDNVTKAFGDFTAVDDIDLAPHVDPPLTTVHQPIRRKGEEAVITVMLEALLDKQRIFEIYLNVIEWGDGVFGAEAAARYHFGGTAAGLSAEQAARLAAMVPSPRRYGPGANTGYLRMRTSIIAARARMAAVP